MSKKNSKKHGFWFWFGMVDIAILVLFLFFWVSGNMLKIHAITRGGLTDGSITGSASGYGGVVSNFLAIVTTGLDEDAAILCEEEYDSCCDVCDTMGGAMCADCGPSCYDLCDENYTVCFDEAAFYSRTTENITWDGVRPTDINAFYETNYPRFYDNSRAKCVMFLFAGDWVDTPNKVGCVDGAFLTMACDTESIVSASNVCSLVGGTPLCNDEEITCNI